MQAGNNHSRVKSSLPMEFTAALISSYKQHEFESFDYNGVTQTTLDDDLSWHALHVPEILNND